MASRSLRTLDPRTARSVQRILEAAARLFGSDGYQGASMLAVARAAGVSKGLLHYHFRSKEHLLVEAQRAIFRQINGRFEERFLRGERGMATALDGLDALWQAVRDMRLQAPFMVETMSLAAQHAPVRRQVDGFLEESMTLLRDGIEEVFADDTHRLAVPPGRLAWMTRVALHGLVVELAYAQGPADVARVDQTYQDFRAFFGRSVLLSEEGE